MKFLLQVASDIRRIDYCESLRTQNFLIDKEETKMYITQVLSLLFATFY